MLAEQGIAGFSAYFLILFLSAIYAYRTLKRSHETNMVIVTGVGIFGVTSMLAHAMVDFNFYIPSNAAYFYVFLALMVCNAHRMKTDRVKQKAMRVKIA
jgi:hypothetical protein